MKCYVGKSWLVVGAEPPPFGGVTVFVQRWIARRKRCGSTVELAYPISVSGALSLFRHAVSRPSFVVVNSLRWQLLLSVLFLFPFSGRIAVDHNHSRRFKTDSAPIMQRLTLFLLNRFDRIWIVSDHLREVHKALGTQVPLRRRSPYLPPDVSGYANAVANYSNNLKSLLIQPGANRIFCISAYRMVFENARDVYGFDIALHGLSQLLQKKYMAKLVMFVADPSHTPAYVEARALIVNLGLTEHVIWEEGQKPLWPMFLHADLFLRPTTTDGWSVSVAEALDLGCPVIASDAVPRQRGCILFSRDDEGDLFAKMKATPIRPKLRDIEHLNGSSS
jgi:glycosyltransferase involved in cell wall biosynthesis